MKPNYHYSQENTKFQPKRIPENIKSGSAAKF